MTRADGGGCPGLVSCRPLCGHRLDVECYQLARDQAEADREHVTALYPGDLALYAQNVPMITFKSYLIGKRGTRPWSASF